MPTGDLPYGQTVVVRGASAVDAPGYDAELLASAVAALSRNLEQPDGQDGATRMRQLARTLEVLCQMVGDAPQLGDALAESWVRTDAFLLAARDAADAGAPDSVSEGLLERGRLELAAKLAELADVIDPSAS